MKLIKSYIRVIMVDKVIEALEKINTPGITAIDIHSLEKETNVGQLKFSTELGSAYKMMVKLEIISPEERVDEIVDVIKKKARTGKKGDGLIIISPVEEIIHIRTGRQEKCQD